MTGRLRFVAGTVALLAIRLGAQAPILHLGRHDFTVARVTIDENAPALRQALGAPDSIGKASAPSQAAPLEAWFYPGLEVLVLGAKVHGIWIRSRQYGTARGLRIDDSVTHARQLYGSPVGAAPRALTLNWDTTTRGAKMGLYIATVLGRVRAIYIGHGSD